MSNQSIESHVCKACGTVMPAGAYHCLACKQSYCGSCYCPVAIDAKTARCRADHCDLFSKPICEKCMVVTLRDTSLAFCRGTVEKWEWLDSKLIEWNQKSSRRTFYAICLATLIIVAFLVAIADSRKATGFKQFLSAWGTPTFFCVASYFIVRINILPWRIGFHDCCPSCNAALGKGASLAERPQRMVPITEVFSWKYRLTPYEQSEIADHVRKSSPPH